MELTYLRWLTILVVAKIAGLGLGCTWNYAAKSETFDLATAHVSNPLTEGIHGTFGPDGAIPLLNARESAPDNEPQQVQLATRFSLPDFFDQVAQQHPSLAAAEAVWQASDEAYPQVTAWSDPQFRFLNGPTLFGTNSGAHLWRLQAQQPVTGWGKRRWRGEVALEQASAARQGWRGARQQLFAAASRAYFDYAMIEAIRPLMEADHHLAEQEYAAKRVRLVSNQDLPTGQEEQIELDGIELAGSLDEFLWNRQEAIRRVNLLLGRDPHIALPPPELPPTPQWEWNEHELYEQIATQHPGLAQAEARCREAEARIELARSNYHPDFVLVSRFDTNADQFWLPDRIYMRPQLGLNVIMPLQRERLEASVREAQAGLRQRRAERQLIERQIQQDVAESLAELHRKRLKMQRAADVARLAQRKAENLERAGNAQFVASTDVLPARRQWLKYEVARLKAEYAWRQQIVELTAKTGQEIPATPPQEFAPSVPLHPAAVGW